METIQMSEINFFDPNTWPLYLLGFLTFLTTIMDDWLNPKRKFKKFVWYLQEFIYTTISIALGISICYAMDVSQSICWIVSIVMGLIGSTFIRKIRTNKDVICDEIIDTVKDGVKDKLNDSIKKDKNENE